MPVGLANLLLTSCEIAEREVGKDEIGLEIDSALQCSGGFEDSALLLQDGGLKNVIGRIQLVDGYGLFSGAACFGKVSLVGIYTRQQ